MTKKRYKEIIASWNPEMMLYIRYKTRYSCGKITMSIAFFMETYKKWYKMLKDVEIVEIYVKNEFTGIVIQQLTDLFSAWIYGLGR